ncbi:MAG: NADH-quinone oxidoreductase subunit NuoF [bacterium]
MKIKNLKDLEGLKAKGLDSLYPKRTKINVGLGTCGIATGARAVFDSIIEEIEKQGIDAVVCKTGCLGFCQKEPLVDVWQPGKSRIIYSEMDPEKARDLVLGLAQGKMRKEWALCRLEEEEFIIENIKKGYSITGKDGKDIPLYRELPFYKKQKKIALRNCGFMNPDNIEEYIARGGYFSLARVLSGFKEEQVIEEIKNSGLRGRGGAGFPTGLKWKFCRDAPGDPKYIICNADEGDPGAYMDRSILEGDPHTILEGMVIGAYAIGSHDGYIYVRNEYPLAYHSVERAIEQAEEYGLLGENIFNSGFDFKVRISQGAGAFVCGEETALLASIEGRIGEPRPRPPFPAERGLWDKPTNINNVKTWANVPVIIAGGANWYSKMGTLKSKGTMVFSLVGKINNTGLVEVPMGIKLREMIYDIGEGIPEGKKFKAVQTGGPSGGCIPSELLDLEVDYEQLTQAGSMMGSGGMVVMDEDTCMVNVAKYFLNFTKDESCGKCTPCREGIKRMLEILDDISKGKAEESDLELLESLAKVVKDASLCALGGTAPNPVLTTLRYFRNEYETHIRDKKCPAHICPDLIHYSINREKCTGCGLCLKECPQGAISGEKKKPHSIGESRCIKCGICFEICNFDAVEVD